MTRQVGKTLTHQPDALLAGIDIGKYAQYAPAPRGPAGKRVHVQQVIALMQRQIAALLLQRTKASVVQLELSRIRAQKTADKSGHRAGICAHDAVHAILALLAVGEA